MTLETDINDALTIAKDNFRKNYRNGAAILAGFQYKIVINNRLTSCAGRASMNRHGMHHHRMEFSYNVLNAATPNDVQDIVAHEFAHCIDYAIRCKSGHDAAWKAIHRACGGNAKRLHRISLKGIGGRDWLAVSKLTGKKYWIKAKKANQVKTSPKLSSEYTVYHISDPITKTF